MKFSNYYYIVVLFNVVCPTLVLLSFVENAPTLGAIFTMTSAVFFMAWAMMPNRDKYRKINQ